MYEYLDPYSEKIEDIFISKDIVLLDDDQYQIEGEREISFPGINHRSQKSKINGPNETRLLLAKFKIDTNYFITQRQVYSVLDFFGDIGGFLSILNIVGLTISRKFGQFIFRTKIFRTLY